MRIMHKICKRVISFLVILVLFACQDKEDPISDDFSIDDNEEQIDTENNDDNSDETNEEEEEEEVSYVLPEIDLSNWKVTLPIVENGKLIEVEPPEILNYATNADLQPFMYNDSIEGALVFYTYPESTTANSSYSRTELREQMVPGSNSTNWTFSETGRMKGTLAVPNISKDATGKYHRTMVMQIHGRITNEQRDLIGENDNNAPPILKIYWQNEKVRVLTKKLVDPNTTGNDVLYTSAWEDNEGFYFQEEVGFEKFSLEIIVEEAKMEIILNDNESVVYDGIHMEKWGVFENYFKAGNYLQTTDAGAEATVKYYELEVTH